MKSFRFPAIALCAASVFSLFLSLAFLARPVLAEPEPPAALQTAITETAAGDQMFLAARDAYRAGNRAKLESLQKELAAANHVLASYADYYLLAQKLDSLDDATFNAFMEREKDSYLGEKLTSDWLKTLAKRSRWTEVSRLYKRLKSPEQEARCIELQHRFLQTPHAQQEALFAEAQGLWLTVTDVPEGCQPLFTYLNEFLPDGAYWQRAYILTESSKQNALRKTLDALPESQRPDAKRFALLWEKPLVWLNQQKAETVTTRARKELVALAIARLANNNPDMAITQLENWQNTLDKERTAWCWGEIALWAARRHRPESLVWFARSLGTLSPYAREWRVRAALRAQNWRAVRSAIEDMPEAQKNEPTWIYWLARADKAEGRLNDANNRFWQLHGEPHFYGNLADEELGHPVHIPAPVAPLTPIERADARSNPGLRRALAFFRLDLRFEGVREWNWAVREMNDRQLLAAATFALENQIYDRAIHSASRTQSQHDYSLRFLAPFETQVRAAAREQSLDAAWMYGLMRQESRFVRQAKSSAGASGLMQLMPSTARWVAKKIGIKDYNHAQVNDLDTNLLLGTSYMRMVLDSLDNHPVLASAAYNAGPGRAKRWCAGKPLDATIYIETIPFDETRDYVKKVMSNTAYYDSLFNGKPASLRERLGNIPAKSATDINLP